MSTSIVRGNVSASARTSATVTTTRDDRAVQPGELLAVAIAADGVALSDVSGTQVHQIDDPLPLLRRLDDEGARWVWWSARETVGPLVARGWRPRACWDIDAVSRLLSGRPPHGAPGAANAAADTLDFDGVPQDAAHFAARARDLAHEQLAAVSALPDPRAKPGVVPLAVLTAYAESAAAVLAVELEHTGLPVDTDAMAAILRPVIGERPVDDGHAAATRRTRDDAVRRLFPHSDDVD